MKMKLTKHYDKILHVTVTFVLMVFATLWVSIPMAVGIVVMLQVIKTIGNYRNNAGIHIPGKQIGSSSDSIEIGSLSSDGGIVHGFVWTKDNPVVKDGVTYWAGVTIPSENDPQYFAKRFKSGHSGEIRDITQIIGKTGDPQGSIAMCVYEDKQIYGYKPYGDWVANISGYVLYALYYLIGG